MEYLKVWDDRAVRVSENTGMISDQTDVILEDALPGVYGEQTDGIGEFLK